MRTSQISDNTENGPAPGPKRPLMAMVLATWFGLGRIPFAPGTMGSFGALPFAWFFLAQGGWPVLIVAAVIVSIIGIWATALVIKDMAVKDPSFIVIDEVAGQWIALLPAGLDPVLFAVGFLAFRLFDIWKPWPVRWADRAVKGAWGVMLDDIIAGGYAAALVCGLRFAFGGF